MAPASLVSLWPPLAVRAVLSLPFVYLHHSFPLFFKLCLFCTYMYLAFMYAMLVLWRSEKDYCSPETGVIDVNSGGHVDARNQT